LARILSLIVHDIYCKVCSVALLKMASMKQEIENKKVAACIPGLDTSADSDSLYSEGDGNSDSESDPVVEEYELFLSSESETGLYFVQYPTRPVYRPGVEPSKVLFKKEHRLLRLEYNLKQKDEDQHFDDESFSEEKGKVQVLTLESNLEVPKGFNYAIGIIDDETKSLHLSPISSTCSMQASLHRLEESTEPVPEEATESELSTQPKEIEVYNLRAESEYAEARRQSSYAYIKSLEEKENWQELQRFEKNSQKSKQTLESLYTQ